jgi:hypothetical protein
MTSKYPLGAGAGAAAVGDAAETLLAPVGAEGAAAVLAAVLVSGAADDVPVADAVGVLDE